jgi:sec-independent protein translocase protein TatA
MCGGAHSWTTPVATPDADVTIGKEDFRMGRIGLPEMLVVFAIVLLIFGPKKLPDLARGLGQAIRGFKEETRETGKEAPTKSPAGDDHQA